MNFFGLWLLKVEKNKEKELKRETEITVPDQCGGQFLSKYSFVFEHLEMLSSHRFSDSQITGNFIDMHFL